MKYSKLFLSLRWAGVAAVGLAFISCPPAALSSSPTLRMSIQASTNQFVIVTWAPPQAALQNTPTITGSFTDVPGATTPYPVDTRLAAGGGYRACLPDGLPTGYVWLDTMAQPGAVVLEWSPRDGQLQQSADLIQWQITPSTPPTDWYYPPTPLEPPPVAGGVQAGMRAFRVVSAFGPNFAPAAVFSVNIPGYANFAFQTGQSNYFSFIVRGIDLKLDTLLPLPSEAEGTTLQFYDPVAQTFGPTNTFRGAAGWRNDAGESPVADQPHQSACVIIPSSSVPGATTVVTTTVGEFSQGIFQRTLPPDYSLNGPLVPLRGGITSTHDLFPNEGDLVFLFNPTIQDFDAYVYFFDEWIFVDDFTPEEPIVGPGDAFFFYNTSGSPLVWTKHFSVTP